MMIGHLRGKKIGLSSVSMGYRERNREMYCSEGILIIWSEVEVITYVREAWGFTPKYIIYIYIKCNVYYS